MILLVQYRSILLVDSRSFGESFKSHLPDSFIWHLSYFDLALEVIWMASGKESVATAKLVPVISR